MICILLHSMNEYVLLCFYSTYNDVKCFMLQNGMTALHLAARFGNIICLQKLLSLEHVVRDKVDKVSNHLIV